MKKFANLPIYFILVGLILNIGMFFYNKVSFTDLMIRSSIITILFAATGYFLASVLREASIAISNSEKQTKSAEKNTENTGSTIDIRVNSEEDDELLNLLPKTKEDLFTEISIGNFKKLMDQDWKYHLSNIWIKGNVLHILNPI